MTANEQSPLWPGAALALGAAALFGFTAPLSKLLLDSIAPQLLAGLLYLGAGVGLSAIQFARHARNGAIEEAPLRRGDLPWLAAMIAAGGVIGPLLLMAGLSRTGAANASLLLNLEGLATMAMAWLVFRENVDVWLLAGALAILAGAALLSFGNGALLSFEGGQLGLDPGAVLIAGACFAWALDNNLTRKLSAADPVALAAIKGVVAGGINVGAALLLGAHLPPAPDIFVAALLGFFGIGLSLVLFIPALRHLGTARAGAYFSLAPFVGALAAIFFLHEQPTLRLAMAGALMALGLWTHLTERHVHEHEHDSIEHDHAHVHDAHHQHNHDGDGPGEPHAHRHRHARLIHAHPHYPDLHHRHDH